MLLNRKYFLPNSLHRKNIQNHQLKIIQKVQLWWIASTTKSRHWYYRKLLYLQYTKIYSFISPKPVCVAFLEALEVLSCRSLQLVQTEIGLRDHNALMIAFSDGKLSQKMLQIVHALDYICI